MSENYRHSDITEQIIGVLYRVWNTLGYGFLEKVYENAVAIELKKLGLRVDQQRPIAVYYDREVVGQYAADLVVEDKVIVELKATKALSEVHEVQLVNYLKATDIEVGLAVNFGDRLEFKRKIFSNERKHQRESASSKSFRP